MPGGAEEGRAREPELAREEQRGVWSVTRVGPPEDNQSVSQSDTPPSMEDGPTRTHTLHTIGSGADTRPAVTRRSTGSGLLDTQHTAHRRTLDGSNQPSEVPTLLNGTGDSEDASRLGANSEARWSEGGEGRKRVQVGRRIG